jgi:hypothetical protein
MYYVLALLEPSIFYPSGTSPVCRECMGEELVGIRALTDSEDALIGDASRWLTTTLEGTRDIFLILNPNIKLEIIDRFMSLLEHAHLNHFI